MSTEVEVQATSVVDNPTIAIDSTDSTAETCTLPNDNTVEAQKQEYSIVGDALYVSTTADSAPAWLTSIIDSAVATSIADGLADLDTAQQSISQALSEIDIAKNSYNELINIDATIDSVITSRLSQLNATVEANTANITSLDTTKVTESEAIAIAASQLSSELADGAIRSEITRLDTSITTAVDDITQAYNTSITTLSSSIASVDAAQYQTSQAQFALQNYVGVDSSGASTHTGLAAYLEGSTGIIGGADSAVANSVTYDANGVATSKWEYDSTLYINGQSYTSGFGLVTSNDGGTPVGTFMVNADKLRFTNSSFTGTATPFAIDNTGSVPQVTFNGFIRFGNGQAGTFDTAISQTTIDGGMIKTGTLDASDVRTGYLECSYLSTITVPSGYTGTIVDRSGISVWHQGVLRVRIGSL